jgi:hypothetical protein
MGFLINTGVHEYIRKRPDLLACQVTIKATDYTFLDHDSYIDCVDLYTFNDKELADSRGCIKIHTMADIKRVVAIAKTIAPHFKKLII